MKRTLIILISICVSLVCLGGCANEPTALKNVISPVNQSQEQKEIVDFLSTTEYEILLFEYKTEEAYRGIDIWVEVYKDGELVEDPVGIKQSLDEGKPLEGKVAVGISQNPKYQWTVIVGDNGAKSSQTGESSLDVEDTLARAYGPISDPVAIEDGKEIVLYTSIFSDDSITAYSDQQEYVTNPEQLKGYPYVHIVKCKFTA
jgi:hypothetical protein